MAVGFRTITYARAPLVEVAISVQFETPRGFTQAHLGAYWESQREEFPTVHSTQGLPAINESFAGGRSWLPPSLRLALAEEPDTRVQMTSADKQWVQQVQADRLAVNWRKCDDTATPYPRFTKTLKRFWQCWHDLDRFLERVNLTPATPVVWEVVYVNRIPAGSLWRTAADWPGVFPGLWGKPFASIEGASLAGLQGQWVWETASPTARLYVEPKPGRGPGPDFHDLLFVTFTARGPLALPAGAAAGDNSREAAICGAVDLGHRLIVSAFDSLNSAKAKIAWGRNDESLHDRHR